MDSEGNTDLDAVFRLKNEDFDNMGYVDSMKDNQLQRFNIN